GSRERGVVGAEQAPPVDTTHQSNLTPGPSPYAERGKGGRGERHTLTGRASARFLIWHGVAGGGGGDGRDRRGLACERREGRLEGGGRSGGPVIAGCVGRHDGVSEADDVVVRIKRGKRQHPEDKGFAGGVLDG